MTVDATKKEQLIIAIGEVERLLTCPLEKFKEELSRSFLNKDAKEELLKMMFLSDSKSSIVEKLKETDEDHKRQLNYPNKVQFSTEENFNSLSQTKRLSTSNELGNQSNNANNVQDITEKEKYISPELHKFLLDYIKSNNIQLEKLAKFSKLSLSNLRGILDARNNISNIFEQKLLDIIPNEYHAQLQQKLNTCIEIPCTNNFATLIYTYRKNNCITAITKIASLLKKTHRSIYKSLRSKDFISIKTAQKLKELIIADPKSDNNSKNLCDEVLYSAKIHKVRIKRKFSLAEFAQKLSISYEELLKIEKTVIAVPDKVKEKFTEIINEKTLTPSQGVCLKYYKFMSPELKNFIFNYLKNNHLEFKEFADMLNFNKGYFYGCLNCNNNITAKIKQEIFKVFPKRLHSELQQHFQTCIDIPQRNNFGLILYNYTITNNVSLNTVATKLNVSVKYLILLASSRNFVTIPLANSLKELITNDPKSSLKTIKLCDEVIFSALLHDYIKKLYISDDIGISNRLGISYKELLLIIKTVIAAPEEVKEKFYLLTKIKSIS